MESGGVRLGDLNCNRDGAAVGARERGGGVGADGRVEPEELRATLERPEIRLRGFVVPGFDLRRERPHHEVDPLQVRVERARGELCPLGGGLRDLLLHELVRALARDAERLADRLEGLTLDVELEGGLAPGGARRLLLRAALAAGHVKVTVCQASPVSSGAAPKRRSSVTGLGVAGAGLEPAASGL